MDWTAINFDWNQTRAFLVTAKEGSFSAAAKAIGQSQPTLSRQVAALEEELKVVLFEKSGRGLILTPVGEELLRYAERMSDAARALSLSAAGSEDAPHGNVSISAAEIVAGHILPKLVVKLRDRHPQIRIEIQAADHASDLLRREADIAIRNFRPTELDLIGKRIGVQSWGLYASKSYVKENHPLDSAKEIEQAHFIAFDKADTLETHLAKQSLSIAKENIVAIAPSMLVGMQLIKNDVGIGVMPVDVGEGEADLQRIASDLVHFEVEYWLVTHRELRTNRRIRLVFDFLTEELIA